MKKLLVAAALAAAPLAFAQPRMPAAALPSRSEPYSLQEVETVAEIVKADKAKRLLTVKDAAGKKFKVHVPAGVAGLDAMKPGALLELQYLPAQAIALDKPGESSSFIAQDSVGLVPRGATHSETTAKIRRMSAMVMDFDRSRGVITLKGPDGMNADLAVPEGYSGWDGLKVGDSLAVQYTEAQALSAGLREAEGASGARDFERSLPPAPQDRTGTDTRRPGTDPLYQQRNEPSSTPGRDQTPAR